MSAPAPKPSLKVEEPPALPRPAAVPPPRPPRHPLSWRRRLARYGLWSVAALAVLVFAATVGLQSERAREGVRRWVEGELSRRLERPVTVGSASFSLLPPVLRLGEVTIASSPQPTPTDPPPPPLATLRALRLEVGILDWGKGLWSLRQVEATEPRLVLHRDPDGSWNLPSLRSQGAGELRLDALVIEGGMVVVADQEMALDGTVRGLRVRLTEDVQGRLRGQVKIDALVVKLPRAEPYEGSLLLNAELLGESLEVTELHFQGEALDLEARGTVRWTPAPSEAAEPLLSNALGDRVPPEREGETQITPQQEEALDPLSGHFQLTAAGDLSLVRRLGFLTSDLSGPMRSTGSLDLGTSSWLYRGAVDSPALRLWDRSVETAGGTMEWDQDGLWLEIEEATFAGGRVEGLLTVRTDQSDKPLELDLRLTGMDAGRVLVEVGLPELPLSGLTTGELSLRSYRGRRQEVDGWGRFSIEPMEVGPGIAVTGDIPLTFERGVLSSSALLLSSEQQRVLSRGEVDLVAQRGRFDFELETDEAGQVSALLLDQLDLDELPAWLPSQGHGTLEGTLILDPAQSRPVWELRLALEDAATPAVMANLGRGSLRVDGGGVDRIHLELETGEGAVLITGESRIPEDGEGSEGGRAISALVFDALGWPLDHLPLWQNWGVALEGAISGRLHLDGPADALEGRLLRASVQPARILGRDWGRLEGEAGWTRDLVQVTDLTLHTADGTLQLTGEMESKGPMDFRLTGQGLNLAAEPLASLLQGRLAGRAGLRGRLRGTLEEPRAQVVLNTTAVRILDRPLAAAGNGELKLGVDGSRVRIGGSLLGLLEVEGTGTQRNLGTPDGTVDLTVRIAGREVQGLAEMALGRSLPQVEGSLAGRLTLRGPTTRPADLEWHLELEELAGRYEDHHLALPEPARLSGSGSTVEVETLVLEERAAGSRLQLAGRLAPGSRGDSTLNLEVQGEVDMAWSRLVWPELDLPGTVTLAGRVVGPPTLPAFDGRAEVTLEPFPLPAVPQTVEAARAVLFFSPESISLETLEAQVGGGTLQGWGQLELTQENGRLGLRGYRLYTRVDDAKLLVPEGWLQKGNAELYLTSTHDGREIRGTVDLTDVRYLATFDLGVAQALRELLEPQRLEVGETDELLTSTRLNIAIKAPGAVRLRDDLANLRGSLDLELQGDLANPILLGKAEVDPGGTVQYAGNDYEVQRGSLTFNNPYRVEPEIDLVARTRLRSYEVNLNVTGIPERLDLDVTSDPPLPRLDVLSLIASGRPPADNARPTRPGVREGEYTAETFLYGEAASALTDRVNTLFGFDKFRIDPLSEGGEAVSSVRFTVGKRLSKDWFVTYSRDPSTTEGDILEAEWQVSRQLLLVFTQNGDGSFSVDALWDRQF